MSKVIREFRLFVDAKLVKARPAATTRTSSGGSVATLKIVGSSRGEASTKPSVAGAASVAAAIR